MNIIDVLPTDIIRYLETLGDIHVVGYSAKGQNGYVVFGLHKILNKRVALKFYFHLADEHPEVQMMVQIDHPNILKVLDARTVTRGCAYFMTEEVRQGDLDSHLSQRSIGLREAISITKGILQGVGALHNPPNHLLHRDLKPENILLSATGVPLIADFGSVKQLPEGSTTVTGSQHAALYRPPESYDPGIFTYSSDLYQVGMVLYQLLGGYLPYDAEAWFTPSDRRKYYALTDGFEQSRIIDSVLLNRSRRAKLLSLDTLPYYVSNQLKTIIKRATHPNYANRYQTTSEFLLAIHNLGTIPDWRFENGVYTLSNCGGRDFRVVPKGGVYICEKKAYGSTQWRKDGSIIPGDPSYVVEQILATV